jgi:S1-C subfamily serine protease
VVDPADEFDDFVDDELRGPLLPPDDRVWRHPSELTSLTPPTQEETLLARRRWMQSTPSRSGARAAGLVGAILATGVVLVGTHLTSWLTSQGPHSSIPATSAALETVSTVTAGSTPTVEAPAIVPLLAKAMASLVGIRAVSGSTVTEGDGLIVSANGYVLVPSALVATATSVTVMRSNGEELAATLVGIDRATGLAVVKVGEQQLPAMGFGAGPTTGSLLLDLWRTGGPNFRLVRTSTAPGLVGLPGGPALLQLCPASLGLSSVPDGAVVVDGSGHLSAMVVAHDQGAAMAAGGPLAGRVATQLIAHGKVAHGWLGIQGTAATPGVQVTSETPAGAAARAGLRAGDVIERVNGRPVSSMGALQADLYLLPPRKLVTLTVVRGGTTAKLHARLAPAA